MIFPELIGALEVGFVIKNRGLAKSAYRGYGKKIHVCMTLAFKMLGKA